MSLFPGQHSSAIGKKFHSASQELQIRHLYKADPNYGAGVPKGLGLEIERVINGELAVGDERRQPEQPCNWVRVSSLHPDAVFCPPTASRTGSNPGLRIARRDNAAALGSK
jgi:hypothetical protein